MSTVELVRHEPPVAHRMHPSSPAGLPQPLTGRELVVLTHLADGVTLEQIARELWVSRNTVKSQVRSLYRKLGVSTRADAVAWATSAGLHPPRSSTAWHKSDPTGRDSRTAR